MSFFLNLTINSDSNGVNPCKKKSGKLSGPPMLHRSFVLYMGCSLLAFSREALQSSYKRARTPYPSREISATRTTLSTQIVVFPRRENNHQRKEPFDNRELHAARGSRFVAARLFFERKERTVNAGREKERKRERGKPAPRCWQPRRGPISGASSETVMGELHPRRNRRPLFPHSLGF